MTTLAANSVMSVTAAGVAGLPAYSSSIMALAINVTTIQPSTAPAATGYLTIWSTDDTEPMVNSINYEPGYNSNLVLVKPGSAAGKIFIYNHGAYPIDFTLDAQGWFTNTTVLPATSPGDPTVGGSRSAAGMISRSLTDRIGAKFNPVNGNVMLTHQLLSLTGVGVQASVNMRYNSLVDNRPSLNVGYFESALQRDPATGNVTFTDGGGGGYVFRPTAAGAATFITPAGVNATLTRTAGVAGAAASTYELVQHPSQVKNKYTDNGAVIQLDSTEDVTGANKLTYAYSGNLIRSITDTQARVINFYYASTANPTQPTTITDTSMSRSIALTYTTTAGVTNGALTKIVDAAGSSTDYAYGANGKISQITDGKTQVSKFTYGTGNKFATFVAAFGTSAVGTWSMAYTSGTITTATDATGRVVTYRFASVAGGPGAPNNLQVTSIVDGNGVTTGSAWNTHNDLTQRTQNGNNTDFQVAANTFNLTQTTAPGGGTVSGVTQKWDYTTTPSGAGGTYTTADFRPKSGTDGQNNITKYTYNTWGMTISAVAGYGPGTSPLPTASTTSYTYHGDAGASCGGKNGQMCRQTDPNGNITNFTYNPAGNLVTIDNPAPLGDVTMTYDNAGRVITKLDGRGNTSYYCYDANDRIKQISYTSSVCATASGNTYTYDAVGNLTSRATAGYGSVSYGFDAQNRMISKTEPSGGNTSATYDATGNTLTFTDNGGTITYRYDVGNRLTFMTMPGGTCPATPFFPNSTGCIGITYAANTNNRSTVTFPSNFKNNMVYDGANRLTSVTGTMGATTVVARTYSWNAATGGADTGLIQRTTDQTGAYTNYSYDDHNRLTGANTYTAGAVVTSTSTWAWDKNTNRTQQNVNGVITNYAYNTADQLCAISTGTATCPTAALAYDGNGNATATNSSTQSFSSYDQRTTSSTLGTSVFAGTTNTERASTTTGGVTTTFTNSLFGSITRTTGSAAGNTEYVRDNTGNLMAIQNGGNNFYYTTDAIGSVILLSNNTGAAAATYVYDSFGNTPTPSGGIATTNKLRYAGGWAETNNTTKFGARWYNPTTGTFDQTDPSGQETNNYNYAGGNPITNTDPTGLFWKELGAAAFGVVVGVGVAALTDNPVLAVEAGVGAAVAWTGAVEGAPIGEILTGFLVDSTS